jgi:hypothetical protein
MLKNFEVGKVLFVGLFHRSPDTPGTKPSSNTLFSFKKKSFNGRVSGYLLIKTHFF